MRISLIGVGYVGLVTGACFAETGHHVVCMDVDNAKIEGLKGGRMPIYEPQLEEIVKNNVKEGRLEFTTSIKEAVDHGIIVCIAVNTPQDTDGAADLSYVLHVAKEIGRSMEKYRVMVVKSTVPVGTCEKVRDVIKTELNERGLDIPFQYNPATLARQGFTYICIGRGRAHV